MLKLSKKTDYAIILMTHLGERSYPVSAHDVAGVFSLPYPMVANILKSLVNYGLIVSSRGHRGGYMLAKSSEKINLTEIIEATDSSFNLVECCKDEYKCNVYNRCPTKFPLLGIHSKIQQIFDETTLFSIIQESNVNTL